MLRACIILINTCPQKEVAGYVTVPVTTAPSAVPASSNVLPVKDHE